MELPKNVVQIGEPDRVHKIFVEDYVFSYIKQCRKDLDGRTAGLALYGVRFDEGGCRYYFLYGAARIAGLEHRGAYLTQSEKEMVAEIGKQYFEKYTFLAWCRVDEEPLESIFLINNGKGMEIKGYACFYEENESMLNYMLQTSAKQEKTEGGKSAPANSAESEASSAETVHSEEQRIRGNWAAYHYQPKKKEPVSEKEKPRSGMYGKLVAAAACFILCVLAVTTLNDYGKMESLQVAARQVITNITEQKLPDEEEASETEMNSYTVEAEGIISEEIRQEDVMTEDATLQNETQTEASQEEGPNAEEVSGQGGSIQEPPITEETSQMTSVSDGDAAAGEAAAEEASAKPVDAVVAYTVLRGDTLTGICLRRYGTLERLEEICTLNGIKNADEIQAGQTILLP